MPFFEDAATDAAEILAEVGRPVTFRAATVSAMIPDQQAGLDLQTGGFSTDGSLVVRFLAADYLAQPPADGEKVTHDGKEYRISSISRKTPSAWFECRCQPVTQR